MKMLPIISLILAAFLATAGPVHAANDVDGKAIVCNKFGFAFSDGKVTKYSVKGYDKIYEYISPYEVDGVRYVTWGSPTDNYILLDRETLEIGGVDYGCTVSSKAKILERLDAIIDAAKKKNKI